MKVHWLPIFYVLLQLNDGITTYFALKVPGVIELNPLVGLIGWGWMIVLKIIFTLYGAWFMNYSINSWDKKIHRVGMALSIFAISTMSLVVMNNLLLVLRNS